jgi:hypothetical protein
MRPIAHRSPFAPSALATLLVLSSGLTASLLVGCDEEAADAGQDAVPSDVAGDAVADAGGDTAAIDQGGTAHPTCEALGLPTAAWQQGSGSAFGDVAGDFSFETLDGPYRFSEAFSGCESYVFFNFFSSDYTGALWTTQPDGLFARGARNVHYFFTSYDADEATRVSRVQNMQIAVEDAFVRLGYDAEESAYWRARVHYVTEAIQETDGSVGELLRAAGLFRPVLAIDRRQRFDPAGSVYNIGASFYPDLTMGAYFARYYNYIGDLEARLAAEADATVVTLLDEQDVTSRVLVREAELPAAAEMARFDSLEVDVTVTCHLEPDTCSEWDRIAWVWWCQDESCETRRELVRWITPYSRPGMRRWVMDATPMLPLLDAGGAQHFRIEMGPDWEEPTARDVLVTLRLRDEGRPFRPVRTELAFSGGGFGETYNDREPFAFTPPQGADRVEVVAIISGHGQVAGNNCAEWCNHEHLFQVPGGTANWVSYRNQAGQALGCAELVDEGVVPGQWGNWSPLRAGWCPGYPVAPIAFDITDDVEVGAENTLLYRGSYGGGEPEGGDISMSAFVVSYEAR